MNIQVLVASLVASLVCSGGFQPSRSKGYLHVGRRLPFWHSSKNVFTGHSSDKTSLLCQLLGMNCATPTDFSFSFEGFRRRGGETDIHADGWGLAFYQNNGLRSFHDDQPASKSKLAEFLVQYPIRTVNMLSHIRYATCGAVDLANVHPFTREMWGIQWCFAHNGHVPMFIDYGEQLPCLGDECELQGVYSPVGATDSEAVLCALLNALRVKFKTNMPSLPVLYDTLNELCREIVDHDPEGTILNFLLTCGPYVLWAYSWPGKRPGSDTWNGLHYTVREPPFKSYHLQDLDYTVDFSNVTTPEDRVAIVATFPLTDDEEWIEVQKGDLIVFDTGKPRVSPLELFQVELKGHGLNTSCLEGPRLLEDMMQYEIPLDVFGGEGI